jgi:UDP-N-acetylmuramyl pentapeptide phosphotransferase/UDP-N-acetylglucosamine-1-phosphate transferase
VPGIDWLLGIGIDSVMFAIISNIGLANDYKIIDSPMAILASACLIVIGAIGGFFILNYPKGLIFLGDGGAHFDSLI